MWEAILKSTCIMAGAAFLTYAIGALVILFLLRENSPTRFLPILSLLVIVIPTSLPTPGAWSDVRSQWMPAVSLLIVLTLIAILSFFLLCRCSGWLKRVTGAAGLLLFTTLTPLMIAGFYEQVAFLDRAGETRPEKAFNPSNH